MKFFRSGFWQKALSMLVILVEVGLLVLFMVTLTAGSLETPEAMWTLITLLIANALTAIFIVNSSSAEEYKVAWLLCIAALPVAGLVFYVLFAHKIRTRRQNKYLKSYYSVLKVEESRNETLTKLQLFDEDSYRISRYIERCSEGDVYLNTSVEYFALGDDAFPAMKRELEKARHYIFIEFFIIKPGKMWGEILSILERKVAQGVDVRVVYDDVGNLGATPVGYIDELRKKGIKAYVFRKIRPVIDVRINNRDHRKIMVIDGHTAFTGGINLADEYINQEVRFGHWKDTAIMVKGKAAHGYTLLFLALWKTEFEPKMVIDYEYYKAERFIDEDGGFPASDGFVQPYGEMPYSDTTVGVGAYMEILGRSTRYVYITTPYLIPSRELRDKLCRAARSGLDIRILTPGIPDKPSVFQMTRSEYGKLLEAGVKVYEYTPGFVHSKMFIADDKWGTEGTINLDYRSLYLHCENGTFLAGSRAVRAMKEDFLATIAVSKEITYEDWKKMRKRRRLLWAFLRLIAPLL